jgi:cation diffusion facilitator CzcD-associated flavoprotein CzcO
MPQENPSYSSSERAAFRDDPRSLTALRSEISKLFIESFANAIVDAESDIVKGIQVACEKNLSENVADPELRERLRPDYRAACKRLVISPDFYDAIQKPNAELVTDPIERVEARGIRTRSGRLIELDVLVLATGFRVDQFLRPTRVTGWDGMSLDDAWAKRPTAYLSVSVPGFPNLFLLNGPNGPVGNFSLIEVAERQMAYILQLIDLVREDRCKSIAASREATLAFDADRVEAAKKTVWVTGCNSWYLDDRGIPAVWPWTFDRFREEMSTPKLDCYEMRS